MEGRVEVKDGRWVPLSVVKGGRAANFLVKACESEWGHKLYGKTLVRQIGMAVYKDRLKIEQGIKSSYPPFANVPSKNFRYGFKIRVRGREARAAPRLCLPKLAANSTHYLRAGQGQPQGLDQNRWPDGVSPREREQRHCHGRAEEVL